MSRQNNNTLNLPFYIARRYLVSKKSNDAITIISWISIIAIAIGTAALVIILSFMNGLTGLVQSLYNSFDPDIEISPVKGKTFVPDSLKLGELKKMKGVKYVCFSLEDNALITYGDKQSFATIKGVSEDFFRMTRFDTMIAEGRKYLKEGTQEFAVLGKGIAFQLSADVKSFLTPLELHAPKRGRSSSLDPSASLSEVSLLPGAYYSINDEFDYKYAVVSLEVARELFGYEKEVSTLEIGLDNAGYSDEVQEKLRALFGNDFIIKNRFEQNKALFSTLQTEKLWTFILLVFILVVATFNIIGALIMLILEKKRDIVTLSNIGAQLTFIRRIFMYEGIMITFTGAIIGLVIGFGFCLLQKQFGFVAFDDTMFVASAYPIDFQLSDFLMILASVFGVGIIAAWFPVRFFTQANVLERFRTQ